jgi:hypothetical protein
MSEIVRRPDFAGGGIAGNRESGNPGIGEWVEKYLDELFENLVKTKP